MLFKNRFVPRLQYFQILFQQTMANRPKHWIQNNGDWYGHAEWCIDNCHNQVDTLQQEHAALQQAHARLQRAHDRLQEDHLVLWQAHERLEDQFADRNKDWHALEARLKKLAEVAPDLHVLAELAVLGPLLGPAVHSVASHSSSNGSGCPGGPAPADRPG